MRAAMSKVRVTLRAEVAAVHMTAEEILALVPGDVVRLGGRAENGVTVYAENTPLAIAGPGASGPRRAVQIRAKVREP